MKTYLSISLFLLLLPICACKQKYKKEIIIRDLSKPKTDTLQFNIPAHQSINFLAITLKGQLNGKSLIDELELLPGKIDTVFIVEWDSSSYILRYIPIDATEGMLEIELELQTEVNF